MVAVIVCPDVDNSAWPNSNPCAWQLDTDYIRLVSTFPRTGHNGSLTSHVHRKHITGSNHLKLRSVFVRGSAKTASIRIKAGKCDSTSSKLHPFICVHRPAECLEKTSANWSSEMTFMVARRNDRCRRMPADVRNDVQTCRAVSCNCGFRSLIISFIVRRLKVAVGEILVTAVLNMPGDNTALTHRHSEIVPRFGCFLRVVPVFMSQT